MFAKFTVLLAVAAVAMGSPVPQDPLEPILSLLGDLPIIGTIIDSLPIATPAPSGLDALPGEIESILSSLLGGAVPTAIIPIAAPPASPTDILGLSSILNEIESLLGDLGLPAGLLSLTDAEKREDDVPSPGLPLSLLPLPAPTPTVTAAGAGNGTAAPPTPVSGALKPTENLDIGGLLSCLQIISGLLGGVLGALPLLGDLGLTLPSSTPVPL